MPDQRRRRMEAAVTRLIGTLDALDGDADLEPEPDHEFGGDDEPSLGWTLTGKRLE